MGDYSLAPSTSSFSDITTNPRAIAAAWGAFLTSSDSSRSLDWRLARPPLSPRLQLALIDAASESCCFHTPAFEIFVDRVAFFKRDLSHLDIPSQIVAAVFAALGVRATSQLSLLGVDAPNPQPGQTHPPDIIAAAGRRREVAWKAIADRAVDLCSQLNVLSSPTITNIETLTAVANMLLPSEVVPHRARFFLRQALGLYKDAHSTLSEHELHALKTRIGPILYEVDAQIAAYSNMPFHLREADLSEFFAGTGVHIPDFQHEDLDSAMDQLLSPAGGRVTQEKLANALALTRVFLSALQRAYVKLSTDLNSPRILTELPQLWSYIDRVHGATQRFHRTLCALEYVPEGRRHAHTIDFDLLNAIRTDVRIMDIIHLIHARLTSQRDRFRWTPDEPLFAEVLEISDMRMRKCFKLSAFYSKVMFESIDKHILQDILLGAEISPWVSIVAQRVGDVGGPTSAQYEVSETELGWITESLGLTVLYTPLAATRLAELTQARESRRLGVSSSHLSSQSNPSPQNSAVSPATTTSTSTSTSTSSSSSPSFTLPASPIDGTENGRQSMSAEQALEAIHLEKLAAILEGAKNPDAPPPTPPAPSPGDQAWQNEIEKFTY